ncbi:TetR/AcrR family transcriptional regulator [Persicimonas caeni]|uniref:TetR/AcrR family transcriptional regulator n=1 Tax=Persicimonas caeni TaxID=2292766 RepID=A0A4Y6PTK3_PERCE|nr:TetR/AcrR family transcriptional regulator [Persicimonas caeni]QDG51563.1 TetR/AcrR family transcriptional regulator [Persicimonas caeni]QED32784.1 TetR/AcrR family transcriptional regulator [Persicimonas caeni]
MSTSDSDGKLSKREQRREDRRDEIKQAAIKVFSEHGYHAAKVSQIVKEVGVAQGTFYLYFEGKEQIFGEILEDFLELVVSTIAAWEPSDLDTREALGSDLKRVGLLLTDVLMENREMTGIFFRESQAVNQELQTLIREFYETLLAMLTSFNRILHERGLIAKMNFRVLSSMTIGMVERVIKEYVVHGQLEDVPAEEVVDNLVVYYLSGTTRDIE